MKRYQITTDGGTFDVLILATDPAGMSIAIGQAVAPFRVIRVDDITPDRAWPDYFVLSRYVKPQRLPATRRPRDPVR